MTQNTAKTKVLVFGTFDGIHDGHRFFLSEAGKLGGPLIVSVSQDNIVFTLKKHQPKNKMRQRIADLRKEKLADKIIAGDKKTNSWRVLSKIKPNIICLGYDQRNLRKALEQHYSPLSSAPKIVVIRGHQKSKLHSSLLNKPPAHKGKTLPD